MIKLGNSASEIFEMDEKYIYIIKVKSASLSCVNKATSKKGEACERLPGSENDGVAVYMYLERRNGIFNHINHNRDESFNLSLSLID